MQEPQQMQAQSLGQEDPMEEERVTYSSILPRESHGQRSLEAYSPWGRRGLSSWALCLIALLHVPVREGFHLQFTDEETDFGNTAQLPDATTT